MAEEVTINSPAKTRWAIAPEWFPQNNRSITAILGKYLCPECSRKLLIQGKKSTPESLMSAIHNCCSRSPGFITEKLPILEAVFRFFLTNGITPLTIDELDEQINRIHGGNAYRYSPEALIHILKADVYYGLQEIKAVPINDTNN